MDKHNSLGGFRDSQGSVVGSTKVLYSQIALRKSGMLNMKDYLFKGRDV